MSDDIILISLTLHKAPLETWVYRLLNKDMTERLEKERRKEGLGSYISLTLIEFMSNESMDLVKVIHSITYYTLPN
jgi:hypothetical protein